jgi:hypothetical protein
MRSEWGNDLRNVVAMDWSMKGIHVTFDGVEVDKFPSTEALLGVLTEPHRIVAESTFESWDPARKAALVARIRAEGHEIYVFRSRNTERVRKEIGLDKSDANDARVIFHIATETAKNIYPLPGVDLDWAAYRTEANLEYDRARKAGGKKDLSATFKAIFGRYRDLPPEQKEVLGNPKNGTYSPTLTAVIVFAAQRCGTREQFEQLLGLHGSACPTLLRSEVLTHSYKHVRKREVVPPEKPVTWTQYRNVVRRAFRQVRDHLEAEGALAPAQAPGTRPQRDHANALLTDTERQVQAAVQARAAVHAAEKQLELAKSALLKAQSA